MDSYHDYYDKIASRFDSLRLDREQEIEMAGEAVLKMNDQPFAGKYLQSRRRIEIAARLLPVRCRALDDLITELAPSSREALGIH